MSQPLAEQRWPAPGNAPSLARPLGHLLVLLNGWGSICSATAALRLGMTGSSPCGPRSPCLGRRGCSAPRSQGGAGASDPNVPTSHPGSAVAVPRQPPQQPPCGEAGPRAGGSAGGWRGEGTPGDPGTRPCPCSIEGGELFERIVDDDYHLTEVDCMVFVRQICEGIRFMHHMRVLHLDLKVRGRGAGGSRSTAAPRVPVAGTSPLGPCPGSRALTGGPCPRSPRTSSASLPPGTW